MKRRSRGGSTSFDLVWSQRSSLNAQTRPESGLTTPTFKNLLVSDPLEGVVRDLRSRKTATSDLVFSDQIDPNRRTKDLQIRILFQLNSISPGLLTRFQHQLFGLKSLLATASDTRRSISTAAIQQCLPRSPCLPSPSPRQIHHLHHPLLLTLTRLQGLRRCTCLRPSTPSTQMSSSPTRLPPMNFLPTIVPPMSDLSTIPTSHRWTRRYHPMSLGRRSQQRTRSSRMEGRWRRVLGRILKPVDGLR